jgi:Carboxypeptidase regulatory-like domain
MKIVKVVARALVAVFGVLLLCLPAFSQANNGRILGNVLDQSGGVIAGATVTITDVERGTSRTLTTDEAGAYNDPNLTPGTYAIKVEYKGFSTVQRQNIVVEVGKEARVDISMQPGEQSQTITVNEAVPMVETTNATLGGTLQPGTIAELPLNGRNFMNLLQLRPGVTIYPGGGAWTQSTNGLRPEHNTYLLDGVITIEPFSAQSMVNGVALSGDTSTLLPVDSIQEFNTQENPKAEYGWKPGAIVNIGLKSGTNSIHGAAEAFGRTDALDAKNPFLTLGKQRVDMQEFGGSAGGPIKKDKVFFFLGYEAQRYAIGNPAQLLYPTMTAGAPQLPGNITTSIVDACNNTPAGNRSPTSLKMSGLNPNCSLNTSPGAYTIFQNGPDANLTPDFDSQFRLDNGLAKLDVHNGRSTLSGSYYIGDDSGSAVNSVSITQPYWRPNTFSRANVIGANWTFVPNSSLVNEARFGFSRFTQGFQDGDCPGGAGVPNFGINFGGESCGFTNIAISPFTGSIGCCASFPKFQGPDTDLQGVEQLSYLHGKHSFKVGGEINEFIVNSGTFNGGKGRVTFNTLEDFIAGNVTTPTRVFVGDPIRHVTENAFAGFAQDDWRVTQRLVVNLGVRYEYVTPIKASNNLLANFDPTVGIVQVGNSSNISLRNNPYLPDKNNFAPRVGFAWDMFGNGKTVLRGGGGIIYVLEGFNIFLSQQNATNGTTGLNTNPSGFTLCSGLSTATTTCQPGGGTIAASSLNLVIPATAGAAANGQVNWNQLGAANGGNIYPNPNNTANLVCATNKLCGLQATDPHLHTAYVSNWNLSIQRAFTNNLSLEVGYVGNHATKLLGIIDENAPALGAGWTPALISGCISSIGTTVVKGGNPADGYSCSPNTATGPATAGSVQVQRPFNTQFPYLSNIYMLGNYFESNYNGLQAALTQRPVHGLSYTLGFTYAHALDDATNDWGGQPSAQNPQNLRAEYAPSGFDIRKRFTAAITYSLPGRKGFAQMLEGWKVTSVVNIQSPLPWGAVGATSANPSGTSQFNERWDFYGNPADFGHLGPGAVPYFPGRITVNQVIGGKTVGVSQINPALPAPCLTDAAALGSAGTAALYDWGCYVNGGSVMIPPALGQYGTMARNTFRGNGLQLWDASIIKDWKFTERLGGEFRWEVFNLLNHTQYANPAFNSGNNSPFTNGSTFGTSGQTPDVANNNPSVGAGADRTMQVGFKLTF